jgi:hypothetical protein
MQLNNRKLKGIAGATLALFTLLNMSGSYIRAGAAGNNINPHQEPPPATSYDGEALPPVPEVVRLSWDNLPNPDAVTVGAASRIVLRVANISREPMRVELFCTADDGGQRNEKRQFGSFSLDPSGSKAIRVDLREFGFTLASLKYSGQLEATARAFLSDQTQYRQTDSPALYFHPTTIGDASSLTFYGEKTLMERFNAGDFRGQLSEREITEAGSVTTRVMFGGSGKPTDAISADDPGEPTEPDDDEEDSTTSSQSSVRSQSSPVATQGGLPTYNFTTCIRFLIRTADSSVEISAGPNVTGIEDHYKGANEGIPVIARGVHVKVWLPDSGDPDTENDWEKDFVADPATGSFNWSHSVISGFRMRVYGKASDVNGNYVRIHDDPKDYSEYPGKTYSAVFMDVNPTAGGIDTYDVGSYKPRWTAMAVLAFGLYRYHSGLSDKEFHVAIDDTTSGGSSAHSPSQFNDSITEGRHLLRLGNGEEDGTPQTKYKFIVTHELGHAIAALYYGSHDEAVDGPEPTDEADYSYTDDTDNVCGNGGTFYSIDSKEWNWIGFREGFAHFIAAKIWNYKNNEGTFTWFGTAYDLERYNFGASNNAGGRLENQCLCKPAVIGCTNPWSGASTIEDWLRFFWDWYTTSPGICADQPSKTDMLRLYRQVRLNGDLTKSNYFKKMQEAVDDLDGDVSDCLQTTSFDFYADHNGINNE